MIGMAMTAKAAKNAGKRKLMMCFGSKEF